MAQATSPEPVDTRRYRTSWRLTFRFDGQRITLVRRDRLQKIAPGTTADVPAAGKNSGTWLQLVDAKGAHLFHRLLADPLKTRAEHHSLNRKIELHVRAPEPCEFSVIVPDIPAAIEARLYASPTDHKRIFEPAAEVGRYSLTDSRPPEEPQTPRDRKETGR